MESGSQPPATSPPPPKTLPPPPPSPPPRPPYTPQVPTESRVQLGKTIWRLFMVANLGLGAYLFVTANKQKDPTAKKGKASQPVKVESPPPPPQTESPPPVDFDYEPDIAPSSATTEPLLPREPISEDQQRELFQWMLEEKRKTKPKDREEKKRTDQEKAILKQFIRAKSIPSI